MDRRKLIQKMKEKISQLEEMLNDVLFLIKEHVKMEEKDLDEFDKLMEEIASPDDDDKYKTRVEEYRENIINHKNDKSIWDDNISKVLLLLSETQGKVQAYKTNLAAIGGNDSPNNEIVQLIKQGISTTSNPISKIHKGKEITGFLTEDGFLELVINGTRNKFSLRRAALHAWETDPPNQWKFWEVFGEDGERKTLDEFRILIR